MLSQEILQASPISGRHTLPRANSMQSLQESVSILKILPITYVNFSEAYWYGQFSSYLSK